MVTTRPTESQRYRENGLLLYHYCYHILSYHIIRVNTMLISYEGIYIPSYYLIMILRGESTHGHGVTGHRNDLLVTAPKYGGIESRLVIGGVWH